MGGGCSNATRDDSNLCAIICKSNPKDIADKITMLIGDKSLYTAISHKLKIRAGELTWEIISAKIEEVLINSLH